MCLQADVSLCLFVSWWPGLPRLWTSDNKFQSLSLSPTTNTQSQNQVGQNPARAYSELTLEATKQHYCLPIYKAVIGYKAGGRRTKFCRPLTRFLLGGGVQTLPSLHSPFTGPLQTLSMPWRLPLDARKVSKVLTKLNRPSFSAQSTTLDH